ncbi:MAG: MFS transporter [Mycobacteriales bacterium]
MSVSAEAPDAAVPTVDEVLEGLPWSWTGQGVIYLLISVGLVFDSWDVSLIGVTLPLLGKSSFHVTPSDLGLFATVTFIGMGVGAIFWGSIADAIGRKRAFIFGTLLYAVLTGVSALSPSYAWLLFFRSLAGVGLGGVVPLIYLTMSEFVPAKVRGLVVSGMDFWWPVGGTVSTAVATGLLPFHNWRLLMIPILLPAVLTPLLWIYLPDSPRYLVRKGRRDQADRVVRSLLARCHSDVKSWTYPTETASEHQGVLHSLVTELRAIWSWSPRVTGALWLLYIGYLGMYFAVITWLPSVLIAHGYKEYVAFLTSGLVTAAGIGGPWIAGWLSEVLGRKFVVIVSGLVSALFIVLFTMSLAHPVESKVWLALFGLFMGGIAGPVMLAMAPEVYPTSLRGAGTGWAGASSRFVTALIPYTLGTWALRDLGLTPSFEILAGLVVIGAVAVFFLIPERRGRLLPETSLALTAARSG